MAMGISIDLGLRGQAAPNSVKQFFAQLRRLQKQFVSYRNSAKELSQLGDRELADLGMSRADTHIIAKYEAFKA